MNLDIIQTFFKQTAQINYCAELRVNYDTQSKALKKKDIREIDYNIVNYIFDYIYREYPVLACIGFQQVRHSGYPASQHNFYSRRDNDAMLMELPVVSLLQKMRIKTLENLFEQDAIIRHSDIISANLTDNNSYEHKKPTVRYEDADGKIHLTLGDHYELKNLLYIDEKNSSEGLDHLIKLHAPKYFYITLFDHSCQNIDFVREEDQIVSTHDLYTFKLEIETQKADILRCFSSSKAKMKQRKLARFAQVKTTAQYLTDLDQQIDKQLDYIQQFAQVDGQIGYSISLVESSVLYPEDYMIFKTNRIVSTDYAFFYIPTNLISSNIYNSIFACQPRVIKDFFENDDGTDEEEETLLIQLKFVDSNTVTKEEMVDKVQKLIEGSRTLIKNKIDKYIESITVQKDQIQEEVYIDIPINTVLITLTKYDQVSMEVKAPKEFQKVKTQSYLYHDRVYKKDPSLKVKLNAKESIQFMLLLQEISYRLDTETKITFDPTEPEEKYLYLLGPSNHEVLIGDLVKTLETLRDLL